MQSLRFYCLLVLSLSFTLARGQTNLPDSRSPGVKQVYYAPHGVKSANAKKGNVKHSARFEFYKRVEKAAKEKQRILKKLSKVQFSDPRYFGHKRIPARRSSHKMRYCEECGIRH